MSFYELIVSVCSTTCIPFVMSVHLILLHLQVMLTKLVIWQQRTNAIKQLLTHMFQVSAINDRLPQMPSSAQTSSFLPDVYFDMESDELVCAYEVDVNNNPTPVAYMPHTTFYSTHCDGYADEKKRFIDSLRYDESAILSVQQLTRGQSANIEWFRQRFGSVTASKMGSVLRAMRLDRCCPTLMKSIQGYRYRNCDPYR
jgi:hypothetical protein